MYHEPDKPTNPTSEHTTTRLDGSTDFTDVDAAESLVHKGVRSGRDIVLPAGALLTADKKPIDNAPEGAIERLDGNWLTKLGDTAMGVSVANEHLHK